MKPFKLNYKRTFIIGFAFFGILMLWQMYNYYCPTILTDLLTKKLGWDSSRSNEVQWIVGIIMALDNVFALFLMPIFGKLSDNTKSKYGKRMPFIFIGTIIASIAIMFIPLAFLNDSLFGVILTMMIVLVSMQMYRNPAVALMPDITPKPLRSKANGIINLVGYVGAIIAGVIQLFISNAKFCTEGGVNYKDPLIYVPFVITIVLMIGTMLLMAFTINENKVLEEMQDELKRGEDAAEIYDPLVENEKLSPRNKRDLIILIVAIFLWFMAFNSIETFWSNYGGYYLNMSVNSFMTIVLTIASLITFIPASILAGKIGRKYTVAIGLGLMIVACLGLFFISPLFIKGAALNLTLKDGVTYLYFFFFIIAGIGWAFINCCSYPMVVELSTQKTIGKFTGIYYFASMLAQSITPIVLGGLMTIKNFAWPAMFPYAAIFFIAAFIVFMFISHHKENYKPNKKGIEVFDQD